MIFMPKNQTAHQSDNLDAQVQIENLDQTEQATTSPKSSGQQTASKTTPINFLLNFKEKILNLLPKKKNLTKEKSSNQLNQPQIEKKKFSLWPKKRWQQVLLVLVFIFILLISATAVLIYYTYQTAMDLKFQANESQIIAQQAYDSFKSQDLPVTQSKIEDLQARLEKIQQTYQKLALYEKLPFTRQYYLDGLHGINTIKYALEAGHKGIAALIPYADVLGFQGEGSFEGGTAENRIKLMIETLEKVLPDFDNIVDSLEKANQEFIQIDSQRYLFVERFKPIKLSEQIKTAQTNLDEGIVLITKFRPVLEQIPNLAGSNGERKKYLILFQNDNELRPTGGFLTAYAVVFVEDGKITPEKSDDIYELDQKFNKNIELPENFQDPVKKYLTTVKYWHLRDMNIDPDFKKSMETFFEHYQQIKSEPSDINGIIAVDTEVLTGLLQILGPVQIPGGSTFSAEIDKRCDCPQVVYSLSEIITKPTPYLRDDRKGILGPLMSAILQKAYEAPKQQWPGLFQFAWGSLEAKHIQLYFFDQKDQLAAEAVNGAGRLQIETGADFLAIINANLGGAKSNLYTSYDVKQVVSAPVDGKIEKTIEINYKNSRESDNCNLEAGELCLNSRLDDWTRIYLPKGSELINAQGFADPARVYDEGDFTVIEGYFSLEPMAAAKLIINYTVPYSDGKMYRVKLWKQGGVSPIKTIMDVTGGQEEILVDKDTFYEVEF